MARGFDSKFVEAQQEEASRKKTVGPHRSAAEQATDARRAMLHLARTRAASDLSRATAPAHRRMLESAIQALDEQIATLARP